MRVVRCWYCDTDRWQGTGPCGTCGATATRATGYCEDDCTNGCAYPGQFSECAIGATDTEGGR